MENLNLFRSARALLRLCRVALHLLRGALIVALYFPFLSLDQQRQQKQRWSRQLLRCLGVRLAAECSPAALDGLIVSNHVSFVDIFVINALTPSAFVCKDDVAAWPLIGWLCRHTETVFLARGSRAAAHRAHRQMVGRLAAGERIAVFPEGTTSSGREVLPCHAALFQSAIDAGVAVRCIALSYHTADGQPSTAAAYIDDLSLLQCLYRIACTDGLDVRVQVLPPLRDVIDRRHLAQHAHHHIGQALLGLQLSAA